MTYGIYQIFYQITAADPSESSLFDTAYCRRSTWINVVETGITVYGLEYGTNNLNLGYNQEIFLQPDHFSFDYDFVANITNLSFNFYCEKLNSNTSFSNFGIELKALKNNPSLGTSTCFFDSSKYLV